MQINEPIQIWGTIVDKPLAHGIWRGSFTAWCLVAFSTGVLHLGRRAPRWPGDDSCSYVRFGVSYMSSTDFHIHMIYIYILYIVPDRSWKLPPWAMAHWTIRPVALFNTQKNIRQCGFIALIYRIEFNVAWWPWCLPAQDQWQLETSEGPLPSAHPFKGWERISGKDIKVLFTIPVLFTNTNKGNLHELW